MRRYAINHKTKAYRDLSSGLAEVRYVLKLENKLPDPPTGRFTSRANALRSSALTLLVAHFEYYLRSAFTEFADRINAIADREGWRPTPDLRDLNGYAFAEYLRNFKGGKPDKLAMIRQAAGIISADALYPDAFGDTRASPKPNTVKEMFEAVGTSNVWPTLAALFNVTGTLIPESIIILKLRHLCEARNEVIHAGAGVRFSRAELNDYVAFVERLALAVDTQVRVEFRRYVP